MKPRFRPVIRVFVSSTFSDLKEERNALAREVFPRLEQYCLAQGFQFQAIDLRWGVPGEAALDHRTMQVCLEELRRAQQVSPRPNFVVLLGDRYGWQPLAESVTKAEFHQLEKAALESERKAAQGSDSSESTTPSAQKVLHDWYRRDDNAEPVAYVLRSRYEWPEGQQFPEEQERQEWAKVEKVLWAIINRAYPASDLAARFERIGGLDKSLPSIVKFQASATEQEIWRGALAVPDAPEHVVAWYRTIRNRDHYFGDEGARDFVDQDPALHTAAEALRQRLDQVLSNGPDDRITPVEVDLRHTADGEKLEVTCDHLPGMCSDIETRLLQVIDKEISEYWHPEDIKDKEAATESQSPSRRGGPSALRQLELERQAHERFGEDRAPRDRFVGREKELKAIDRYLRDESDRKPLVVYGPSGTGKTALLARAAQLATDVGRAPIVRFLGATPQSSNLRSLLTNLCRALRAPEDVTKEVPAELRELQEEFGKHLASATWEKPILLFLDALDQLDEADGARKVYWLRTLLPPHVKVVVSCIYDADGSKELNEPYHVLELRKLLDGAIAVESLSAGEAMALLERWLEHPDHGSECRRRLTGQQRKMIEARIMPDGAQECRRPFYLRVLFEECRLWPAWKEAQPKELGANTAVLLQHFFERLEQPANHGRILVESVLGYIASARRGLNENEILEVLWADPDYKKHLDAETVCNKHELPVEATRIPMAIWSRLRHDLDPYLAEHAAPGGVVLNFYHREVGRIVTKRFLEEPPRRKLRHGRLAKYFQSERQPWWRDVEDSQRMPGGPAGQRLPNARRASELPWLLLRTADDADPQREHLAVWDAPANLLCDLELVGVKCAAGLVFELQEDYRDALNALPQAQERFRQERERQARLDRWAAEITEYVCQWSERRGRLARGEAVNEREPRMPQPPRSCRVWTGEEIEAEYAKDLLTYVADRTQRLETPPSIDVRPATWNKTGQGGSRTAKTRVAQLQAFRSFVRSHAHLLSKWMPPRQMVLQFAFNSGRGSPVAVAAGRLLDGEKAIRVMEPDALRRRWNPYPALNSTVDAESESVSSWECSVKSLDFSADGRRMLAVDSDKVTVWELGVASGPTFRRLDISTKEMQTARISADGSQFVGSQATEIIVCTRDGVCTSKVPTDESHSGLCITADAELAVTMTTPRAVQSPCCVTEYNLRSGTRSSGAAEYSRDIDALAMSADGKRIVTAHHDRLIRLHNLHSSEPPMAVPLLANEIIDFRLISGNRVLVVYTQNSEFFLGVLGPSLNSAFRVPIGEVDFHSYPIAISQDGKRAVVGNRDGTVRLLDLFSGEWGQTFHVSSGRLHAVALRQGDRHLVAFSDDWDRRALVSDLWILSSGNHKRYIASWGHDEWSVQALLPDGNTVVTKKKEGIDTVELRDWRTARLIRSFGKWEQATSRAVVSQKGRKLFTGSWQSGILEWNLTQGVPPRSIAEEGTTIRELAVDAEGLVGVSSREDSPIRVWDLDKGKVIKELPALSDWDAEVCISADGRWVATLEHEFMLRVWDGRPGEPRTQKRQLHGHRSPIMSVNLTPDGTMLLSGSWDSTARIWDLESGNSRVLEGHEGFVNHVAMSADARIGVSAALDATIRVWDLVRAEELKVIERGSDRIDALGMTADARIAASGHAYGRFKFWDIEKGSLQEPERRHKWFVSQCCLLPDTKTAVTASGDGSVGIWDLMHPDRTGSFHASDCEDDQVQCIVPISGGFASTGQDGTIRIWDAGSRECVATLREKQVGGNSALLTATSDGAYLLSAFDQDMPLRLWSVASRRCVRRIRVSADGIDAFARSADNRQVVTISGSLRSTVVQLWDLKDGTCLSSAAVGSGLAHGVFFTPQGDRLVLNIDSTIELRDLTLNRLIWQFPGEAVALNPSGRDLVVASGEEIHVVDLSTGRKLVTFSERIGKLPKLAVLPDGNWLVSADKDGAIRVWSMESGQCVAMDALESPVCAISRIARNGLFACGTEAGQVAIRQIRGIAFGPLYVTRFRPWIIEENNWSDHLIVCCPECGTTASIGTGTQLIVSCKGCDAKLILTSFVVDNQ